MMAPIIGNATKTNAVMGKNTSVSLGVHFESFVEDIITLGRYQNASEVIRASLRLLEEEETRLSSLKNAIQTGIDSGIAKSFDTQKHLESLKKKQAHGWLSLD